MNEQNQHHGQSDPISDAMFNDKPAARHLGNGFYNTPKPKKKRRGRKVLAYAAVGVLGIVLGSAATGGAATAEPVEVIKEVPGPVQTETVTEEVEVEVTPQACIDALDSVGSSLMVLTDLPGMVHEAAVAGYENDMAAIEDITERMGEITAKVEESSPGISAASSECRAKATP